MKTLTLAFALLATSAFAQVADVPPVDFPAPASMEVPVEGAPLAPTNVMPQPDISQSKPAMVVRFNQKRVYFDRALSTTVSRAEQAKPNVVFNVVSVLPQGENGEQPRLRDAETAKQNQVDVVNGLRRQGVNEGRIRQQVISEPGITAQEVRVYVQ